MEYMGNKEFWNEKFAGRGDNPLNPEEALVENIFYFKQGTVLDIACGDGRNSLFLLENGFKVTGIDFSSEALERLKELAEIEKYEVHTKQIDLSKPYSLENIGIFDNVIINHYRLSREQLKELKNHLNHNGILFVCGFGYKHKVDSKIRKDDLIQRADFEGIDKYFELVKYKENQDERGFFVTYIFKKI